MGQKNYELLNKAPNYLFWNSMWYSNTSFKNFLYLDFFLKNFIKIILSNKISNNFFKNLNNKNFKYLNFVYLKSFNNIDSTNTFLSFTPYFSKFWLLIYKDWVFFIFFFFYPTSKTLYLDNSLSDFDNINIQSNINFKTNSFLKFFF